MRYTVARYFFFTMLNPTPLHPHLPHPYSSRLHRPHSPRSHHPPSSRSLFSKSSHVYLPSVVSPPTALTAPHRTRQWGTQSSSPAAMRAVPTLGAATRIRSGGACLSSGASSPPTVS